MKVYTVEIVDGAEYDCTKVEGIFSTMEKAETARDNLRIAYGDARMEVFINEVELDYDDRARR